MAGRELHYHEGSQFMESRNTMSDVIKFFVAMKQGGKVAMKQGRNGTEKTSHPA